MDKILVVDDEKDIGQFIAEFLKSRGYLVRRCTDPRASIGTFIEFGPSLCVLDFRMPAMGGDELFHHFRSLDPTVEAVFLTAETDLPLALKVVKLGAFDYLSKPVTLPRLMTVVLRALEHRSLILENRAYHERLQSLVAERTVELNDALALLGSAHVATLEALGLALDFRDQSTSGHSRRVADLTKGIAQEIGISGEALVQIEDGALLHDIGKLRIPDSILLKPGSLSPSEWKVMRCHAEYGRQFLERIESLSGASQIVYAHHEKFNGKGYPRGLKGDEIPIGARCFAIVDAVDALIYERPYHKAISFDMASDEIKRCAGTHFDPELIGVALDHIAARLPQSSAAQTVN